MTEEQIILSKRAVACKGFRRLPGMRAVGRYPNYPVRVYEFGENLRDTDDMEEPEPWGWQQVGPYGDHVFPGPYLPDLQDPATLGCLLALVREAWGMPTGITVTYSSDEGLWGVSWSGATHGGCCGRGETEGEALVAALESAP